MTRFTLISLSCAAVLLSTLHGADACRTVDVVIVIDGATPFGYNSYTSVQQFVAGLLLPAIGPLAYVPGYARVAVIIYGNANFYEYNWDMYTSEELQFRILSSSMPAPQPQYSNMAGALKLAVSMFSSAARSGSDRRLILLSDGDSSLGGDPVNFAQQLRDQNVCVLAIGVPPTNNEISPYAAGLLTAIADTTSNAPMLSDASQLWSVMPDLNAAVCGYGTTRMCQFGVN